MKTKIQCPLCGGCGKRHGDVCRECHGSGEVKNHFALAGPGERETDAQTAAAECRPLEEVQDERKRAATWLSLTQ